MSDEAAFLVEIRANPRDPAPRLAYADWLEGMGDPRGALIRIEEEMGTLPVFADRSWRLKPRRDELRAQAPPDWLGAMGYGLVARPVFRHGWPDGLKERWRLIRSFVERWHRVSLPDVGGRAVEVREVEARLGRALPPSLREWVAFAHDARKEYHGFGFILRDIYQFEELEGHRAVSFLLQGEGDYHWAVHLDDFDRPDSPVYGYGWDFDEPEDGVFVPDGESPVAADLTSFVLEYAMGYTMGQGGGFGVEVGDSSRLIRELQAWFPIHCRASGMDLFEDDDILVRISWFGPGSERVRLLVEVARPLPFEAIPPFLWEYTRNGGCFHGMFIPR